MSRRPRSAGIASTTSTLATTRLGFVIADVTGHGLAAALVMANFQAAVYGALNTDAVLPDLTARINRLVCRKHDRPTCSSPPLSVPSVRRPASSSMSVRGTRDRSWSGQTRRRRTTYTTPCRWASSPTRPSPFSASAVSSTPAPILFYTDGLTESADAEGHPAGDRSGHPRAGQCRIPVDGKCPAGRPLHRAQAPRRREEHGRPDPARPPVVPRLSARRPDEIRRFRRARPCIQRSEGGYKQ